MQELRKRKQTIVFSEPPSILSFASVVGKMEACGPLSGSFDLSARDGHFGQISWEKAETHMQRTALQLALQKAALEEKDLDAVFLGDLLNQCIGSSFSMRGKNIPTLGLYGACSTMAEGMLLAGMSVAGGFCNRVSALSSSHFASSERQYRFPLGYGGQRPPTAQWTVTGCGAVIIGKSGNGPYLRSATIGCVTDAGVTDGNNMGAAMAPAAFQTILAHFRDTGTGPKDYDLIVTGDLGKLGSQALRQLFEKEGIDFGPHYEDCGVLIFDLEKQDVHCGGSGCGCSAAVLCGYLLGQMQRRKINRMLFCGTGALLSPVSIQQGESIPSICHAVELHTERS
ncbi:MAG: stage V sporulation protein AD [Oscillospiraceae bacterium]|nr:stage V sporulation protein AD [Oscillospiraceae bacterium]